MSLSSQWKEAKAAWDDDTSSASPGARFGLMFDPTAYMLDAVGYGDKYRDAVKGSGDWMNEKLSSTLGTNDRGGWAANKPASTIGLMVGGYYAGGGLLGSGAGSGTGAGAGGGTSAPWGGVFGQGGTQGMSGVGTGNAGQLFANTGINTGGVGSVGGTGSPGFMGSMQQMNPQQMMQLAQQMPGAQGQQQQQQQQQSQPPQGKRPYLYRGQVVYL